MSDAGYYVYTIHNIVNNKIYVGKTKNPHKRWDKHIKVALGQRQQEKFFVHRAISKYGIANFIFSIVQCLSLENEANLAEKYWVSYFKSNEQKYGYNLTDGGEGVSGRIVSEETRLKQREKAIGRKHSTETLKKISNSNNHNSKLNVDFVKEIRSSYKTYSIKELSEKYCVSPGAIAKIVYNQCWYDDKYISPAPRKINSNGVPKLTLPIANEIRKKYGNGITIPELSKLFNVTERNIRLIIKKEIWNE